MARKAEWEKLKKRSVKRFGKDSVFGSDHGNLFDSELGLPAPTTYHPAYLLRLRGVGSEDYNEMKNQVIEDLSAAWKHAHGHG